MFIVGLVYMMSITRQQHLKWCIDRANEYLERGDPQQAFASFESDMRKHPETQKQINAPIIEMVRGHTLSLGLTHEAVKSYIEGFP